MRILVAQVGVGQCVDFHRDTPRIGYGNGTRIFRTCMYFHIL